MNQFIYDIFEKLEEDIPNMKQADEIITQKIEQLLQHHKKELEYTEYEELRDLLFSASHYTKRELFAVGFYYAVELLLKNKLF